MKKWNALRLLIFGTGSGLLIGLMVFAVDFLNGSVFYPFPVYLEEFGLIGFGAGCALVFAEW